VPADGGLHTEDAATAVRARLDPSRPGEAKFIRWLTIPGLAWRLALIAMVLSSVFFFSRYVLFIVAISYMLSGVITRLSFTFRRRPSEPTPPAYEEAPEPR